jgi:hypothetical protein
VAGRRLGACEMAYTCGAKGCGQRPQHQVDLASAQAVQRWIDPQRDAGAQTAIV